MALLIIYCVFLSTLFYFSLCFACSCLLLRFAFRLTSRFRHQQSVSPCRCTYTVSPLTMACNVAHITFQVPGYAPMRFWCVSYVMDTIFKVFLAGACSSQRLSARPVVVVVITCMRLFSCFRHRHVSWLLHSYWQLSVTIYSTKRLSVILASCVQLSLLVWCD